MRPELSPERRDQVQSPAAPPRPDGVGRARLWISQRRLSWPTPAAREHGFSRWIELIASPEQRLLLVCHDGERRIAIAFVQEVPHVVRRFAGDDRRALTDEAWPANAKAVMLMLEPGFDPSVQSRSGPTGGTALHCAAWEGSADCVLAILANETGRALVEARDPTYGSTPLGWCCHGSLHCGRPGAEHATVARILLAAGTLPPGEPASASDAVLAVLESL